MRLAVDTREGTAVGVARVADEQPARRATARIHTIGFIIHLLVGCDFFCVREVLHFQQILAYQREAWLTSIKILHS
jgi:hypothetical protein